MLSDSIEVGVFKVVDCQSNHFCSLKIKFDHEMTAPTFLFFKCYNYVFTKFSRISFGWAGKGSFMIIDFEGGFSKTNVRLFGSQSFVVTVD